MKLTLDTSQKNKACVLLTAAWKPCVIKFVFVPNIQDKRWHLPTLVPLRSQKSRTALIKVKKSAAVWVSKHFTVPYAKSNSVLAKASKCCSRSASNMTFSSLSSHIAFHKGSGLKLFLWNMQKSPVEIYQGGFLLHGWGFVIFAASDTYSGNFRVGDDFIFVTEWGQCKYKM